MAEWKYQFKHGPKATMPKLDFREPGITDDTEEFFVGGNTQNIQLAKQADLDNTNTNVGQKLDKTSIVDNLTSTDATVPLSANQGQVLKGLVDTNTTSLAQIATNINNFPRLSGETDDTARINRALASTTNPLTIFFPAGDYTLGLVNGGYINISRSNVTFVFANGANFRQKTGEQSNTLINIGWNGTNFVQVSNIRITGGNFYGNSDSTHIVYAITVSNPDTDYSKGSGSSNIEIEHCNFYGSFYASIIASGVTKIKVHDCYFTNNIYVPDGSGGGSGGYGILTQTCLDVHLYNNEHVATANDRHPMYISVDHRKTTDLQSEHIDIHDNKIDWTLANDPSTFSYGTMIRACKGLNYHHNRLKGAPGGVVLNPSDGTIEQVVISENIITDLRSYPSSERAGIIVVDGGTNYTRNVKMLGNVIKTVSDLVSGIWSQKMKEFTILDNTIDVSGASVMGIKSVTTDQGVIDGNKLNGNSTSQSGLYFQDTFTNVSIGGSNHIYGFTNVEQYYNVTDITGTKHKFTRANQVASNGAGVFTITAYDNRQVITAVTGQTYGVDLTFNKGWLPDASKINLVCNFGNIGGWGVRSVDTVNNKISLNLYDTTFANFNLANKQITLIVQIFS